MKQFRRYRQVMGECYLSAMAHFRSYTHSNEQDDHMGFRTTLTVRLPRT